MCKGDWRIEGGSANRTQSGKEIEGRPDGVYTHSLLVIGRAFLARARR
jgi:hypothetical protein